MGLRDKYENHHKCIISAEAVEAAVSLSARYIADRFLPDKAIDLLDEAGSRARINAYKRRKENQVAILSRSPSEYWQEIRAVQAFQESVHFFDLFVCLNLLTIWKSCLRFACFELISLCL